jgi:hypothetical protein
MNEAEIKAKVAKAAADFREIFAAVDHDSAWLIWRVKIGFGPTWDNPDKTAWGYSVDAVSACRSLGGKDVYGVDDLKIEAGADATDDTVKLAALLDLAERNGYRPDPEGMEITIHRPTTTQGA